MNSLINRRSASRGTYRSTAPSLQDLQLIPTHLRDTTKPQGHYSRPYSASILGARRGSKSSEASSHFHGAALRRGGVGGGQEILITGQSGNKVTAGEARRQSDGELRRGRDFV